MQLRRRLINYLTLACFCDYLNYFYAISSLGWQSPHQKYNTNTFLIKNNWRTLCNFSRKLKISEVQRLGPQSLVTNPVTPVNSAMHLFWIPYDQRTSNSLPRFLPEVTGESHKNQKHYNHDPKQYIRMAL